MVLKTSALTLVYDPGETDGKFTPDNLTVSFSSTGKKSYGNRGRKTPAIFWAPPVRSICPRSE